MIISTLLSFLWMCIGKIKLHVGDSVTLSCSYKDYTGNIQNLQWYRQYPRSKPEFLLYIFQHGAMSDDRPPRFTAAVNQDNKQVDLKISSVVETDSAIYYCALRATVTGNLTASYKNLPLSLSYKITVILLWDIIIFAQTLTLELVILCLMVNDLNIWTLDVQHIVEAG
uniref:Ig-like domain-containing protein n=1 Tax=Sinocyclocheilus rhinocerous TaxID=307959 RepID=A0A673GUL9_9TELE